MGFDHSAYFFYGVHVPRGVHQKYGNEEEYRLDVLIESLPVPAHVSLGHLSAGDYDRNELFLVCGRPYNPADETTDLEVPLGTHKVVHPDRLIAETTVWDMWLSRLVAAAGYSGLEKPGWIVVPDVS